MFFGRNCNRSCSVWNLPDGKENREQGQTEKIKHRLWRQVNIQNSRGRHPLGWLPLITTIFFAILEKGY